MNKKLAYLCMALFLLLWLIASTSDYHMEVMMQ